MPAVRTALLVAAASVVPSACVVFEDDTDAPLLACDRPTSGELATTVDASLGWLDRALLDGYAGVLNTRPLSAETVGEFAEYLWQFAFFPQRYKKVLDSYAGASGLEHTLLLAFGSSQGAGRCDRIEVVAWRFTANASSGAIERRFELVRSFEAEVVDGSPRLCQ